MSANLNCKFFHCSCSFFQKVSEAYLLHNSITGYGHHFKIGVLETAIINWPLLSVSVHQNLIWNGSLSSLRVSLKTTIPFNCRRGHITKIGQSADLILQEDWSVWLCGLFSSLKLIPEEPFEWPLIFGNNSKCWSHDHSNFTAKSLLWIGHKASQSALY